MSYLTEGWNVAVTFLQMQYRDNVLSTGSAFYWKQNDRTFLITNRHNLSGWNAETDKAMSNNGGIPDRISFLTCKQISAPDANGQRNVKFVPVTVKLCDEDWTNPRWLQHPKLGKRADIAAIDVTNAIEGSLTCTANSIEDDAILQSYASQDVFILGYPLGLIPHAPTPVWKRGTIATDPTFDPDGLPVMYVDTASRSGMSGSLVIARHMIVGRVYKKKDGTDSEPLIFGKRDVVLGIYSGRLGADEVKAQLGIVWKRSVIEETVTGNAIADVFYLGN